MNENSIDGYIFNSLYNGDLEKEELIVEVQLTGALLSLSDKNIDDLMSSKVKIQEEEKSSKGLILKKLPKNLKYAFLGEEKSKLVIITTYLTTEKKSRRWWRL